MGSFQDKKDSKTSKTTDDFAALLFNLPIPVFELSTSGMILKWNPTAKRVFNLSPDYINRPISDLPALIDCKVEFSTVRKALINQEVWESSLKLLIDSNDVRAAHCTIQPLPSSDHLIMTLSSFQAMADESSALFFENAVRQSIDGIAIADLDGTVRFSNRAWAHMHGYEPEELQGRNLSLFHTEQQYEEDVLPFNEIVRERGANKGQVGHCRKDGSIFPTFMTTTLVRDDTGKPFALCGIARDISDQVRNRNELYAARNSLEETVEARTAELVRANEKLKKEISDRKRVENALRDSLRTSSDIVQAIPSGLFIYQFEAPDKLYLQDANPAAQHQTGIDIEQWRGKEFRELWPNFEEFGVIDRFLVVARTGVPYVDDNLVYRDEKITGYFQVHVFRMPGNRLGVGFDNVTEKKLAEQALRESEARFRSIFDGVNEGIRIETISGDILDANPAAAKLLGYTQDELVGKNAKEIIPESAIPNLQEVGRAVSENKSISFEAEIPRKNGDLIPVEISVTPMKIDEIDSVVVIFRDITERRLDQKNLEESEQKYRSLFEDSKDGVLLVDLERQEILDTNSAGCEMLGCEKRELAGTKVDNIFPPEARARILDFVFKTAQEDAPTDRILEVQKENGMLVPVSISSNQFEFKGRQILQLVLRDMTIRMNLEKRLRDRAEEIELLNDILTHDISNIGQTVLTYINLMLATEADTLSPDVMEILVKTKAQIGRITSLLDKAKMIALARAPEEGKGNRIDLSDVLSSTIRTVQAQYVDREVKIEFTPCKGAIVAADGLIHQVFFNLLENAVKHNDNPTVEISVAIREQIQSGRHLYDVVIEDNGSGIPDELKPVICNRFASGGLRKGSGLGLAIVKALTNKYGGRLDIEDRVHGEREKGARFLLHLPAADPLIRKKI